MATPFLIVRVDQLPAFPAANAMYIVKDATRPERANVIFTGRNASDKASLITFDDVNTIVVNKITQALENNRAIEIFETFNDMMEVVPEINTFAYVKNDMSGQGGLGNPATYIYDISTSTWIPLSSGSGTEVSWNSIIGRPTATPSQIDQAVSMAHTHENMSVLNQLSSTPDGQLTFDDRPVGNVVFAASDW